MLVLSLTFLGSGDWAPGSAGLKAFFVIRARGWSTASDLRLQDLDVQMQICGRIRPERWVIYEDADVGLMDKASPNTHVQHGGLQETESTCEVLD
jgi:hypothetical protein